VQENTPDFTFCAYASAMFLNSSFSQSYGDLKVSKEIWRIIFAILKTWLLLIQMHSLLLNVFLQELY